MQQLSLQELELFAREARGKRVEIEEDITTQGAVNSLEVNSGGFTIYYVTDASHGERQFSGARPCPIHKNGNELILYVPHLGSAVITL